MKNKLTFKGWIGLIVAMLGLCLAGAEPVEPGGCSWLYNLLGLAMFAIPCIILIKKQNKDEQRPHDGTKGGARD